MKISQTGIDLIKKYEGLRLKAYKCPAGKLTVGYGTVIDDLPWLTEITEETAEVLLMERLEEFEAAAMQLIKVRLTQNQLDAILSFMYNIGISAFKGSTFLKRLNNKDPHCSDEFLRWCKVGSTTLHGLLIRRKEEKKLFDTP